MSERRFLKINQLVTTPKKTGRYPVVRSTFWRWVAQGKFPQPQYIGGIPFWALDVIEQHESQAATIAPRTADAIRAGAASVASRRAKRAAA